MKKSKEVKKIVIQPSGFFATPKNMEALTKYCESFTGSEKLVAFTVMGMTWNLAAKVVNQ